jgi:hypothetical protein
VCDAALKILARQGAAAEFLMVLKQTEFAHYIPPWEIPEACFYDTALLRDLEQRSNEMGVGIISYETAHLIKNKRDYYTTTFFVGDDEYLGSSYNMDHSKLLAAKGALETLSGRTIHPCTITVSHDGNHDGPADELFTVKETQARHVITLVEVSIK